MPKYIAKISRPRKHEYEIIIPSAGMGKRMKSYGPKCLINLHNNYTIFKHQLNIITSLFEKFTLIVVCGFESHRVINSLPSNTIIVENERYTETNVVRSIGLGLNATRGNNVIIVYGDLVFNRDALNFDFEKSCMIIDNKTMSDEEVGCVISNGLVQNITYDLPNKWGQIVYLTGKELKFFKTYCGNKENHTKFGFEAINYVINRGGRFEAVVSKKTKIIDVDKASDLEKARQII
jgi:choline kinase